MYSCTCCTQRKDRTFLSVVKLMCLVLMRRNTFRILIIITHFIDSVGKIVVWTAGVDDGTTVGASVSCPRTPLHERQEEPGIKPVTLGFIDN